jgi:hypothetical protein
MDTNKYELLLGFGARAFARFNIQSGMNAALHLCPSVFIRG